MQDLQEVVTYLEPKSNRSGCCWCYLLLLLLLLLLWLLLLAAGTVFTPSLHSSVVVDSLLMPATTDVLDLVL